MSEAPAGCLSFCDLKSGMRCRVSEESSYGPKSLRLADLGLVPGAEFDVVREAPFGDPIEIALNGVRMAVRRKDAQAIWVKTLADS